MIRPFIVLCLVFAGTWSLAGRGWALLAAAFLVFALWRPEPDWAALRDRGVTWARGLASRVKDQPKRATAVGGMTAGIALLPFGLDLSAGAGVALAAAGVLLIGVAVLTGWGA